MIVNSKLSERHEKPLSFICYVVSIHIISGFLAGIYVPFNDMPSFATAFSGLTPFPHAIYLLSSVLFGGIYTEMFGHLPIGSDAVNEMSTLFICIGNSIFISNNFQKQRLASHSKKLINSVLNIY